MSVATIKVLHDDTYAYIKMPYCENFLNIYRKKLPKKFYDVPAGTGWQASLKLWVFSLECYEDVEALIQEAFDGETYWQFVDNMDELTGEYA
jgi:hypothetical protein